MSEFNLPTDIGNRACQHLGVKRMDATLGFADPSSKAASEIGFVFAKMRRAELRRNPWRFAIRRAVLRAIDTNTMLLAAALWVSNVTYFVGSIVIDSQNTFWISRIPNNLGNQPQSTSAWEPYFGPLTVSLFDATSGYSAGELVYTAAGDGTNRVFLSLQSNNTDSPATATAWDATTTYFKNQTVTYLTVAYQSLTDLNINNIPSASPALFNIATTYAAGDQVSGSDGIIYTSIGSGNLGHDPVSDLGAHWTNTGVLTPWATVFVGGTGSLKWLQIGGAEFPSGVTLTTLNIVYPVGAGPFTEASSRNVYRLPANYLRDAPQDPRAGSTSYLGAPSGRPYDDWNMEGNYLTSGQSASIAFRFVADVADVTMMDDMFCEGLGARIALAVCETVTQSTAKLGTIAQNYQKFMSEARLVNAIEIGPVEPPLDDYIACRY